MSLVHRVVILNKPLKIRGFTPMQWVMVVLAVALGFGSFTLVPKEIKFGNLPGGFILGLSVFCVFLLGINALEMKPIAWWKNMFLYRLKILPVVFLPHPEEPQQYPDPTIFEPAKASEQFYVQ